MPYPKMKPEVKAEWLKALRSGKYKQTVGSLCRVEAGQLCYCCLGVLCDVRDPTRWSPTPEGFMGRVHYNVPLSGVLSLISTDMFLDMFEVPADVPDKKIWYENELYPIQCILSGKNDSGVWFSEIADWIEANL